MRTRQRRKRKGEDEKDEDGEEKGSDDEVPRSLLEYIGEKVLAKHCGKNLLSVASLDSDDVALFVVAAATIKKRFKNWKGLQFPKTDEDSGEQGEETRAQQSPRTRRWGPGGKRKRTSRPAQGGAAARPETATLLTDKIVATAFFEPSTRTRCSFEAAAMRLGGRVLSCSEMTTASSIKKGETLEDTIRVLAAYADVIVLRHPEQNSAARAAAALDPRGDPAEICCLINAGDGAGEHPTQALLDIFTIAELFPEWWSEQLQHLTKKVLPEEFAGEKKEKHSDEAGNKSAQAEDDVGKERKEEMMQHEKESREPYQQPNLARQTEVANAAAAAGGGGGEGNRAENSGSAFKVEQEKDRTAAEGGAVMTPAELAQKSNTTQDGAAAADAETKQQERRRLTVAFVGDLKHGRTVHSLALLLSKFDCRIITLSPADLALPLSFEAAVRTNLAVQEEDGQERLLRRTNFADVIKEADVLYMTRTQVLHPLPRIGEIEPTVDRTPFCAYFTQAENGLYMRMALLAIMLNPNAWQSLSGM